MPDLPTGGAAQRHRPRRNWAVIQHVDYDGEGAIGHALRRAECPWVSVRPFRGDPVPRAADLSGLIVLGAPDGSADDRGCQHLVAERRLIADAVGLGLPVLGVCFGAQLLAVALGGRVISDGLPEVGMGAASLTAAGRADRVLGSAAPDLTVLHWHRHSYTLPRGAVRLATSSSGIEQAFRVNDNVYGLQFHVEINAELARAIADQMPEGALASDAVARASAWGNAVLDRFLAEP
ncbi:MAG TPA: type 1 glutamine amidotransferase [Solirubrobacteraceae bacterium]|nr:type 1 glutamine amidotransferase [Solirubrobacteraceae bacterium]